MASVEPLTFQVIADPDTATLSALQIKELYESNSDTNALTDALLAKLEGLSAEKIEDIEGKPARSEGRSGGRSGGRGGRSGSRGGRSGGRQSEEAKSREPRDSDAPKRSRQRRRDRKRGEARQAD